ncbi:Uncharacterized protein FWK35_00005120 [Aphis craccivora]|uniref:Reverse transcriptase domain-containing protein n=1 Tax=Aphis craccivora TaxID=307492 RepID=A0A6G0ZA56_APHCR|nr:Uncharacterized protein FWK35_00005120 [Aphis craccivora]
MTRRATISGYTLISALYHRSYGSAIYVRNDIKNWSHLFSTSTDTVYIIAIRVAEINILNIYKPPNKYGQLLHYQSYHINQYILGTLTATILDRDMIGRHQAGGARATTLIYASSQKIKNLIAIPAYSTVLNNFPRSQHRPILINVGIQIPIMQISGGSNQRVIITTVLLVLLKQRQSAVSPEVIDEIIYYVGIPKISNTPVEKPGICSEDLTRTRQEQKRYRKLNPMNLLIIEMTRATMDKETARKVSMNLKTKKREAVDRSKWAENFNSEEVLIAFKSVKTGKAAGLDGIHLEFFKNYGPNTRKWLADFFSDILCSGKLPKLLKTTKVLAALKPEKPKDDVKSYRPISLLSASYKLLERLIYNRISKIIDDEVLPQEQAGNRQLTVYIGEEKSKTRVLNNSLSQGSVLVPLLFNLYTKDLPSTSSIKFIYADDIALASQSTSFEGLEEPLTNDLRVVLDRTLTYREHLTRLTAKVKTCQRPDHHFKAIKLNTGS